MPVTFQQVVELVFADNNANGRTEISKVDVESIARKTIKAIGMGIAENGDVYNPAPVANPWTAPKTTTTYWSGNGGRRRNRR